LDHALNKKRTTAQAAAGPQTLHRLGKILIVDRVRDETPDFGSRAPPPVSKTERAMDEPCRLQASFQGG
jgi:hypothetical protein